MSPVLRVVAAVIRRPGQVLLSQRPDGAHLSGLWEFPGGKVEPGEDDADALRRELREELGIEVRVGGLYERVRHAYPERTVELWFYECEIAAGEPRPLEVAAVGWFDTDALDPEDFPAADQALVLRLARQP